ncbi:MAG: N-acetyltransferase [Pseudomonadota bacterium]
MREANPKDLPSVLALYPAAFPDEDLLPLVRALADTPGVVSLVAEDAGALTGHVAFSHCHVDGNVAVALLGPVAVAPTHQRQGVGSALVQHGIERERAAGTVAILILGDPAYYGRFGFRQEHGIEPPYKLPDDWGPAWQSLVLHENSLSGPLAVPEPWQDPVLWS